MNVKKIYLSGGMSDISKEQSVSWRNRAKQALYSFMCFDPWEHFDFVPDIDDREILELDLWNLRNSDIVIVNFNAIKSLGTMSELAIAYDRRIPIIGYLDSSQDVGILHPWQKLFCNKLFSDWQDLFDYITVHYSN